jgi:hypothetical protein
MMATQELVVPRSMPMIGLLLEAMLMILLSVSKAISSRPQCRPPSIQCMERNGRASAEFPKGGVTKA